MTEGRSFTSLEAVKLERARLRRVRDHHAERLERHWAALQDHHVRGQLLRDAAADTLRAWRPTSLLAGLIGGGSLTAALGSAIFRRGGLAKRIFFFGASLIVPLLLKRASSLSLDDILEHLRTAMDSVRGTKSEPNDDEHTQDGE